MVTPTRTRLHSIDCPLRLCKSFHCATTVKWMVETQLWCHYYVWEHTCAAGVVCGNTRELIILCEGVPVCWWCFVWDRRCRGRCREALSRSSTHITTIGSTLPRTLHSNCRASRPFGRRWHRHTRIMHPISSLKCSTNPTSWRQISSTKCTFTSLFYSGYWVKTTPSYNFCGGGLYPGAYTHWGLMRSACVWFYQYLGSVWLFGWVSDFLKVHIVLWDPWNPSIISAKSLTYFVFIWFESVPFAILCKAHA